MKQTTLFLCLVLFFIINVYAQPEGETLVPFSSLPTYPFNVQNLISKIIDFDNDGDDDVYGHILGQNASGRLYRNDGNMSFVDVSASSNFPTRSSGVAADLDKNGFMDVYYWIGDTIAFYLNNNGVFSSTNCSELFLTELFPIQISHLRNVRFADFNNDGFYDLLIIENDGSTTKIWAKQGELNCGAENGYGFTDDSAVLLLDLPNTTEPVFSTGDINNDGAFDLLIGTAQGGGSGAGYFNYNYSVYLNNGYGNFYPYNNSGYNLGRNSAFGSLGEFNNDGITDFFCGSSDCCVGGSGGNGNINPLYVYLSNSLLNYSSSTTSMLRATDRKYYNVATVADINLDCYQDIVWTNIYAYAFSSSALQCYINDGDGTFSEQGAALAINVGTSPTQVMHTSQVSSMLDMNNDHKPDLHVASFGTYDQVFYNNYTKINEGLNHGVKLKLNACRGLREGWGARLKYKCNGTWYHQQHNGYSTSNYPFIYLGMADATVIDSIVVDWVGGANTVLTNIDAGGFISIDENESCDYAIGITDTIGCTIANACNFNPNATIEDNSCQLIGESCNDGNALTSNDVITSECTCEGINLSCPSLNGTLLNGLVGYWPFCGNANDESGNGNDGVVNGATLTEDRFGNVGSAYYFDGNYDVITNPELDSVNLTLFEGLSMSIWFNTDTLNLPQRLIHFTDGQYDLSIHYSPADQKLLFVNWDAAAGENYRFEIAINENEWIHAVWALDFANNISTAFINGVMVNTPTNIPTQTGPNSTLRIGNDFNLNAWPFFGSLDDIGIWNRALTAEEIAILYGNFNPQVTGCTDPLAFNYNAQATINEGCLYTASVFVYNDLNGNGEHEGNEPGLSNWPVVGNDINGLLWTNGNGNAFVAVPQGAYQFTVLNTTDNWVLTTEASGILSVGSNTCTDQAGNPIPCPNTTLSFGLQVIPGEAIVAAGPFTGFWDILHCTDGYESGVYLENIGSQTVSGFMTLTCDPLFTPNASSYFTTPPAETGPGYALWNIEDFLPGEYELLSYFVPGPGVEYLNAVFNFSLELTLLDPQGNIIYDETWDASPIVACAYDPNDLTGYPEGLSAPHKEGYTIEHFMRPDNMVEFRVRFQNTGTLPAEDIDIYIPIDASVWDLSTIEPLARAADMQVLCLHDGGDIDFSLYDSLEHDLPEGVVATDLLIFSFEDIFLPDSASDPDGSQGYVFFQMQAKHGLDVNTELNAQAFIYFEQNPPITTNETYHVIFDCESFTPMVGDTEICDGESLMFDATQPYVDTLQWQLNNVVIGNDFILDYPAEVGEYTLELITGNVLCSPGKTHEVTVIVHEIPELEIGLDETVCEGEQIIFNGNSDGSIIWSNGATTGDTIVATESFVVTATVIGEGGCTSTRDWSVTVNPTPSNAVDITGNVLSAEEGNSWNWSFNGVDIASTQSITVESSGNYQVEVTNEFGCSSTSDIIFIENVFVHSWPNLTAYPNPMKDLARIELPQGTFDVALYDITGACVRIMQQQQGITTIERASLASGVYQVRIVQGEQSKSLRLVIE